MNGSTENGILTGALGGASAGTSVSPGIGTIIGAIAGGVLGGVSGNAQYEQNKKERQAEIERLQKREDTAQTRAAIDSLSAGIDPRLAGVNPAQSSGVAPIQSALPDVNQIPQQMSAFGNTLSDIRKQKGEIGTLLGAKFQDYLIQGEQLISQVDGQINDTIERSATLFEGSSTDVKKFDKSYTDKIQDVTKYLTAKRSVSSEVYDKWRELKSAKGSARKSKQTAFQKAVDMSLDARLKADINASASASLNPLNIGGSASVGASAEYGGSLSRSTQQNLTENSEKGNEFGDDKEKSGEKSKSRELSKEQMEEFLNDYSLSVLESLSSENGFKYSEKDISTRQEFGRLLMSLYLRKARYMDLVNINQMQFMDKFYPQVYELYDKLKFPY